MKFFFIILILAVAIFVQTTFLSLPFVFLSLLLFAVLFEEEWIFIAAFFAGILLDILSFKTIGISSIFFVIAFGGVFLYKRKYEIQSLPFITIFAAIGSGIYLIFSGSPFPILQAGISGLLAGILFVFISKLARSKSRSTLNLN